MLKFPLSLSLFLPLVTLSRGRQLPCFEDTQEAYGEARMMKNQGLSATLWVSLEANIQSLTMWVSLEVDLPPVKPWDKCSSGRKPDYNSMTDPKSELPM